MGDWYYSIVWEIKRLDKVTLEYCNTFAVLGQKNKQFAPILANLA